MILTPSKVKLYDPKGPQIEFHKSEALYKGMIGAFGSGKSRTGCEEGLALSLEFPGNVGLVARDTLPNLKMTTMRTFFSIIPQELLIGGRLDKSFNKTERVLTLATDPPSIVFFGPLDDMERYKSLELGWFFVDEGSGITLENWLILTGRLRHPGVRLSGMMATNPTSKNHWVYKYFIDNPPADYAAFRSKTADNTDNLPPNYMENLRKNYPPDFVKMFVDGEFGQIQAGDPQFPDFSVATHCRPLKHSAGQAILRGWDFGIRHPVCILAEFDEDGRFKIMHTVKRENEDLYIFRDRVKRETVEKFPGARIKDYCDIAGTQRREDGKSAIMILNEGRVFPLYRYSKPGQRMTEIRKMQRQSVRNIPSFLIDASNPANTYMIDAFVNGTIEETGEPLKDGFYEHGLDGCGYIIANTVMIGAEDESKGDDQIEIEEADWGTTDVGSANFEGFEDIEEYV